MRIKLRLICGQGTASPRTTLEQGPSSSPPRLLCAPRVVEALGSCCRAASAATRTPFELSSNRPCQWNRSARPFKGRESTARIQLRNIVAAVPRRSIRDPWWQRTMPRRETKPTGGGTRREGQRQGNPSENTASVEQLRPSLPWWCSLWAKPDENNAHLTLSWLHLPTWVLCSASSPCENIPIADAPKITSRDYQSLYFATAIWGIGTTHGYDSVPWK